MASPVTNIDTIHPGLGDLAILPREVRDRIASFVASSFPPPSTNEESTMIVRRILCKPVMRISHQLRREYLEAYLRDNEFTEPSRRPHALIQLLEFLSPYADIAAHTRSVGTMARQKIDIKTDRRGYTMGSFIIRRVDDGKCWFPRQLRKLRHCHDELGIPAHKLFIIYPDRGWPDNFLPYPVELKIVMSHPEASMQIVNKRSEDWDTNMPQYLSRWLSELGVDEEPLEMQGFDVWLSMLIQYSQNVLEREKLLIEEAMQFWREKDEFERYCLGDFFALAEAWGNSTI